MNNINKEEELNLDFGPELKEMYEKAKRSYNINFYQCVEKVLFRYGLNHIYNKKEEFNDMESQIIKYLDFFKNLKPTEEFLGLKYSFKEINHHKVLFIKFNGPFSAEGEVNYFAFIEDTNGNQLVLKSEYYTFDNKFNLCAERKGGFHKAFCVEIISEGMFIYLVEKFLENQKN